MVWMEGLTISMASLETSMVREGKGRKRGKGAKEKKGKGIRKRNCTGDAEDGRRNIQLEFLIRGSLSGPFGHKEEVRFEFSFIGAVSEGEEGTGIVRLDWRMRGRRRRRKKEGEGGEEGGEE